jgi:hypothetical protein
MVHPRILLGTDQWRRNVMHRFSQKESFQRQIEEREQEPAAEEQYRGSLMPDAYAASSPTYADTPKDEYYHELYPDELANAAMNVSQPGKPGKEKPVTRHTSSRRNAQIVDEQKFVEKVGNLIWTRLRDIPWMEVPLSGGALETLTVNRAALLRWFEQRPMDDKDADRILQVAGTEQGLSLIGDAFILAGLADQANLGMSKNEPILILYRPKTQPTEE